MFRHHLQHLEILLKCVRSAHFEGIYLQYISENCNFNGAMKYFSTFDKNVATIFQLQ